MKLTGDIMISRDDSAMNLTLSVVTFCQLA